MTRALRLKLLVIASLSATVISACTAHHPSADASGQTATSADSATTASSVVTNPTTAPPTTPPPSPISSVATSTAGSSSVPGPPTCATNQLRLTVRRGASASQQAFATLILTNGGSTCATAGFPGVSLLLAGRQIGPAAERLHASYAPIDLSTGASAHAQLTISTSCNAERSDTVRVYPPDQTTTLTARLAVFACTSTIGPLQRGVS